MQGSLSWQRFSRADSPLERSRSTDVTKRSKIFDVYQEGPYVWRSCLLMAGGGLATRPCLVGHRSIPVVDGIRVDLIDPLGRLLSTRYDVV